MRLGDIVKYKNYIILTVVYLFTVGFTIYLSDVYKKSTESSEPEFLNEITNSRYDIMYDNVYNYSLEHSDFSIYVANNKSLDDDDILFIDSDKISSKNLNRLIFDFGYNYNISKDSVPFSIVFKDGKIKEIVHD